MQLAITPTLTIKIMLPGRNVTLSELQRLKRQFVTVHRKSHYPWNDGERRGGLGGAAYRREVCDQSGRTSAVAVGFVVAILILVAQSSHQRL